MAQGIQPVAASGARGPTPQAADTESYPLEWTSNSPGSNLKGGRVGGGQGTRTVPSTNTSIYSRCNIVSLTIRDREEELVLMPKRIAIIGAGNVGLGAGREARFYASRQTHGNRTHGELQRPPPRRVPERESVPFTGSRQAASRCMASRLQSLPTSRISGASFTHRIRGTASPKPDPDMCLIFRNEWSPNGGNVICQKALLFNGVFLGEAYEGIR